MYPYRCTKCGHRFEKIQHFGAKPETVCPKCGGVLERTLTAPGLNFKGAGWYVNDYASKSSGSKSETGSAEKKPVAETKAEGKAESKTSESSAAANSAPSTASTTPKATTK